MNLNNVTFDSDGTAITRVEGITLRHEPDCAVFNPGENWYQRSCSCYIIGLRSIEFPDGTILPTNEPDPRGNEAHINWLRDELVRQQKWRRHDRRYLLFSTILGSLGWLYGLAQGMGWL